MTQEERGFNMRGGGGRDLQLMLPGKGGLQRVPLREGFTTLQEGGMGAFCYHRVPLGVRFAVTGCCRGSDVRPMVAPC